MMNVLRVLWTTVFIVILLVFCETKPQPEENQSSPMQKKLQSILEKPKQSDSISQPVIKQHVKAIAGLDELNSIVENSPGKLLVFDLYADWCMPCKMLSPLYDTLAETHSEKASFFRVDVQRHQDIASAFRVQSIPLVVFIKDKEVVHSVQGLNSRDHYEKILLLCKADISVAECKEAIEKIL